MFASRPATGSTLAFLELFLGPANATFSGHFLLGIFDPADELVARQRCDVLPGIEGRGIGDQRVAQVSWKLVHHPTGYSRAAHGATVAPAPFDTQSVGARAWSGKSSRELLPFTAVSTAGVPPIRKVIVAPARQAGMEWGPTTFMM